MSRTSSFADRSYGTRTNLVRQSSFTLQDYSSAARRSSIFDGVAGYSIYSSISEGLDNITSGIRNIDLNEISRKTIFGGAGVDRPCLNAFDKVLSARANIVKITLAKFR